VQDTLALIDWRRRVAELYADVRRAPEPESGWRVWRDGRDALCRSHSQSPIAPELRGRPLPVFPYDPALRFLAELEPVADEAESEAPAGADGVVRMTAFARTRGLADALGGELTLFWIGGYGGGVFLPFRDGTSGRETYGGGRYLLDGIKGADLGTAPDGRTVLDFNFAYHPSCAHQPVWTCPLAPPENRLPAPVRGGERFA
jgi:uncharacterized protein (DUF1684 family)